MIIDFHTHTFPKKIVVRTIEYLSQKAHMAPSLEGTGEGLLSSMQKSGVDYAVTFGVATKAEQVPKLNDVAIQHVDDPHFIYFGSAHPHYPKKIEELERLKEAGVKGIKIHPVYQQCPMACPNFLPIYRECVNLDLIVITHAGFDIGFPGSDYSGPEESRKVMEAVPDLKLVLAHMGGWKQWDEARHILSDYPVYIDTSFSWGGIRPNPGENHYSSEELLLMNKEEFLKTIEAFGYERVLFGTDSPWTDQIESIEFIRSLGLSQRETDAILGENAKKLLNI